MISTFASPATTACSCSSTFRTTKLAARAGLLLALTLGALLPADSATAQTRLSTSAAEQRSRRSLEQHRQRHAELRDQLLDELDTLLTFCKEKQQAEGRDQVQAVIARLTDDDPGLKRLPVNVQPEIPNSLPADERHWRMHLRKTQQEYARGLYILARTVLRSGFASYAFELVHEVAAHDPDHTPARGILGFERFGDEWITRFAKLQRGGPQRHVWHDKFGWLPTEDVERYEQGERRYLNRWIPAAQEAEIRQDFRNAWSIRTDHFLVKTNHSLERGVEVAVALEEFHHFLKHTFASFFYTTGELQQMFASGARRPRGPDRPYRVHYFRTRDEYNQRLATFIPEIGITNGLYYPPDRTSYFFADPQNDNQMDSLFHEATHQMLYEYSRIDRGIAQQADFWIVEGIACYMESFRRGEDGFTIGDPNHIRFDRARFRLLQDRYYVPLADFSRMGMQDFQADLANIAKNYSQAAGLAHFLMHYQDGVYREALIAHLEDLYRVPRRGTTSRIRSLATLTGTSFDDMDRQYITYIRAQADSVSQRGRRFRRR